MRRLLAAFFITVMSAFAAEFTIVTEEYPPFSYTNNGQIQGVSTEIVKEMCRRLDHPFSPEVLPWARGYLMAKSRDNVILYSTTRIPAREKLFKWVGPLVTNHLGFFVKKGSGVKITSYEDAKKLGVIGTYKDDVAELMLQDKGFTNIESIPDDVLNSKKLVLGRLDAWFTGVAQGYYRASQAGVVGKLENVYRDSEPILMYMAFSKSTDDAVIARWQKTLDQLVKDGFYDRMMAKYLID